MTALNKQGEPINDGDTVTDVTGKQWLFHEVTEDGRVYVSFKRIFARYFHPSYVGLTTLTSLENEQ
jgi:hypothetical protein